MKLWALVLNLNTCRYLGCKGVSRVLCGGAYVPAVPGAARAPPKSTCPPLCALPTAFRERLIQIPELSPQLVLTQANTDQLNFTALFFIEEHLFLVPTLKDVLSVLYPIESSVKLH